MKPTITFLLLILLLPLPRLYAQDFWETLPFPDSLHIACIAINSEGSIFVGTVTSNVTNGIYRSEDSGETWEIVLNTSNFQIYSMTINVSGHIYVSKGGFEPFIVSYDNGNTWQILNIPYYTPFSKIHCIGTDTILCGASRSIGSGVVLLRTIDEGSNWDTLFITETHPSEYISDIAITGNGDIYISMMCFYPEIGGVYKSTDNGLTWDYVGLQNHQVQAVEVNAEGDLFIGVYGNFIGGGGGIYAIYHDNPQIIECLYGPDVNGLAVNSAGDIYAGIGWPDGIIVSKDNGNTFEFNNFGLPQGPVGKLYCDHQDYIFALSPVPVNWMCKSIEPTVGIKELSRFSNIPNIQIAPNPVQEMFQGRINGSLPDGSYAYIISDFSGKKIVEGSLLLSQNLFSIDISFLPPGFYLLKVNCNGCAFSAKIIKI